MARNLTSDPRSGSGAAGSLFSKQSPTLARRQSLRTGSCYTACGVDYETDAPALRELNSLTKLNADRPGARTAAR